MHLNFYEHDQSELHNYIEELYRCIYSLEPIMYRVLDMMHNYIHKMMHTYMYIDKSTHQLEENISVYAIKISSKVSAYVRS